MLTMLQAADDDHFYDGDASLVIWILLVVLLVALILYVVNRIR